MPNVRTLILPHAVEAGGTVETMTYAATPNGGTHPVDIIRVRLAFDVSLPAATVCVCEQQPTGEWVAIEYTQPPMPHGEERIMPAEAVTIWGVFPTEDDADAPVPPPDAA